MVSIGSLCTGYGGLDMGLQSVIGGEVLWQFEYDKHASKILKHNHPHIPNHGDITATDWDLPRVDWLTAGYPCQPFSTAGKRKGTDDARHIWPYIKDAIRVLRPRGVLLENVAGHLSLGFGQVLGDLAAIGYDARWVCVRAADAGAPHSRKRLFIVANPEGNQQRKSAVRTVRTESGHGVGITSDTYRLNDGQGRSARMGTSITDDARQFADSIAGVSVAGDAIKNDPFGEFAQAVNRWTIIMGRPAPQPLTNRRLEPAFVEWMMGLQPGWVTDVSIGRDAKLKALGNGVVPQQAALALRLMGIGQ